MIRKDTPPPPARPARLAPDAPVIIAGRRQTAVLSPDGELETLTLEDAARRALRPDAPPVVCHMPFTARRLGVKEFPALDILELFAFTRPARFCAPTPAGLAAELDLPLPKGLEDQAVTLHNAVNTLLGELAELTPSGGARAVAAAMGRGGWLWGPFVLAALRPDPGGTPPPEKALAVWDRIPNWKETAQEPPAKTALVSEADARARLAELLSPRAERRSEQSDFAAAGAAAFQPRNDKDHPRIVLAEAGTGVGKTLGYIAPASLWAERSGGTVWISTYTRNLQRQLDAELDRLFPNPDEKAERVVVRKGRENYLCLLNFQEAAGQLTLNAGDAAALGLMARWAEASRDGDMEGGDYPAWLTGLLGRRLTKDLRNKRGECTYGGCPHYGKCLIEHSVRKSAGADIVVANHALVMTQAALGAADEADAPLRYVFDEGHHLFDAADSAFALELSGRETGELRRWLAGGGGARRSRARGLSDRIGELTAGDDDAKEALSDLVQAAGALPAERWQTRLKDNAPQGPAEIFLARVREQVYARAPDADSPYSLECDATAPVPGLLEAAVKLSRALERLEAAAKALIRAFQDRLSGPDAEDLDSTQRNRLDAAMRGLERRVLMTCKAWREMLAGLAGETPEEFCAWMTVERFNGRDIDAALRRHWIDPMRPFAETVYARAHGALVTSATLCDPGRDPAPDVPDAETDTETDSKTDSGAAAWAAADRRAGTAHLAAPPVRFAAASPFDFAANSRIFVVTDLGRNDIDQTAAAMRVLFEASGGGALGLFTAIGRLRAAHQRIAEPLEDAGLPLYAQHVDELDSGTLIDIFRAERDACLLGTDAVRDGVDVPGEALRLIVFDRVPWPRPDILHRARREHFGGRAYDDTTCRLRLRQAFGRLIRKADDRGVFVMLDSRLPSRIARAFPEGAPLERVGLKEAAARTRDFLSQPK
ncbi:MAG: ATP-dependent DNA helicase [Rhodospirillales bacterium]